MKTERAIGIIDNGNGTKSVTDIIEYNRGKRTKHFTRRQAKKALKRIGCVEVKIQKI